MAIPGYHFDTERNRWFKISPGHHATSSSSAYTTENIQQASHAAEMTARQENKKRKIERHTVQRCKLTTYTGSIISSTIQRESSGQIVRPKLIEGMNKIWVTQLVKQEHIPFPDIQESTFLAFDERSGGFLAATNQRFQNLYTTRVLGRLWAVGGPVSRASTDGGGLYQSPFSGPVTSMSVNSRSAVACFATIATGHEATASVYLIPYRAEGDANPLQSNEQLPVQRLRLRENEVWCTASNRHSSNLENAFAIGTSQTCLVVTSPSAGAQIYARLPSDKAQAVRAVDWLDRNVVAVGQQDELRLWDLRSQGTVSRLKHATALRAVNAVNESFLIMAGLNGVVAGYDLRYAKDPILQYGDRTYASHACVIALSKETHLLAVTHSDGTVNLFNVDSGTVVGRFSHSAYRERSGLSATPSVCFGANKRTGEETLAILAEDGLTCYSRGSILRGAVFLDYFA